MRKMDILKIYETEEAPTHNPTHDTSITRYRISGSYVRQIYRTETQKQNYATRVCRLLIPRTKIKSSTFTKGMCLDNYSELQVRYKTDPEYYTQMEDLVPSELTCQGYYMNLSSGSKNHFQVFYTITGKDSLVLNFYYHPH